VYGPIGYYVRKALAQMRAIEENDIHVYEGNRQNLTATVRDKEGYSHCGEGKGMGPTDRLFFSNPAGGLNILAES
jgi:hypothetical protein